MSETTFSFAVDDALKSDFAAAAEAQNRTSEDLPRAYMREVVREREEATGYDAWFRRQVQKGRDSVAAGDVWSNEEVEAEFAALRADARRRLDGAE